MYFCPLCNTASQESDWLAIDEIKGAYSCPYCGAIMMLSVSNVMEEPTVDEIAPKVEKAKK